MTEKKICPEWRGTSLSVGTCKKADGWLCEKSYAIKNWQDCPFYNKPKNEVNNG